MGDWWASALEYGDGLLESVGEGLTSLTDGLIDAKVQEIQNKKANVEVQKTLEPVKGKTVSGQTIVDTSSMKVGSLSIPNNMLYVGGGLVALVLVYLVAKK
jgi:hypothetical protein